MKKLLLLLALVMVAGCAGFKPFEPFETSIINQGEERLAGIGDTFFEHTEGRKMTDPLLGEVVEGTLKFDLTILELNKEKIGLQYNEFFYQPPTTIGYKTTPGGWMVKQGYNKRFDYAVADKVIRFKSYEFEIISAEPGRITYRRTK